MSRAVFQNIRKLYSGETDVAIRSGNCISTCIIVHVDLLGLAAFLLSTYAVATLDQYIRLGQLSEIDEMSADHLKLLGYEVVLLRLQPTPQVLERGRTHCTDLRSVLVNILIWHKFNVSLCSSLSMIYRWP